MSPNDRQPQPLHPSKPDLQAAAEKDRTVTGAENQRRFDVPKRTTLTDLPAARPPERKPTLSGLPAPPALPLEHAKTQRAPSTTAQTMRATPAAGIRIPPDETTARSQRDASLPPVSAPQSLQDGQTAVLRAALAEERERRHKAEALAARPARVESEEPPAMPRGATRSELRRAAIGLLVSLTALLGPVGIYIATRTEAIKPKVDATATNTGINADGLKVAEARLTALEKYLREKKKHDDCVNQQLRSGLARGGDHDLPTLPPGGTDWVQQRQPSRSRTVDDGPTYIAIKPCPDDPAPPTPPAQ